LCPSTKGLVKVFNEVILKVRVAMKEAKKQVKKAVTVKGAKEMFTVTSK